MSKRVFTLLIAMTLFLLPLSMIGAAITASYYPEEFLEFSKGNDLNISFPIPASYNNETLVALLGVLILDGIASPVTLKSPSLVNSTTSVAFNFRGPFDWNPWAPYATWPMTDNDFYLDTATYINGVENLTIRQSRTDGVAVLTNPTTVTNVSTFTVLLFLRAHHAASKFKPGEEYNLKSGTIGSFNFAVSPTGNIDDKKDYIPIGGHAGGGTNVPPSTSTPILGGTGGTSGTPVIAPYIDGQHPSQRLQYLLSFINVNPISLANAYGSLKTKVADAQISMVYGKSGKTYKVNINFNSSSVKAGKFNLYLDGNNTLYGIPYSFDFAGTPVVPGNNYPWIEIPYNTPSVKTIRVTEINKQVAEAAPSGTYQDTIIVNITAVD